MEHRRIGVFALFLVVCFSAGYARAPRKLMVNGIEARIEDYPFAAVVWAGVHMCGGAIIDQRHILTAAHCTMFDEKLYNMRIGLWGSVIIAGTEHSFEHTPDVVFEIEDFIWHPDYATAPLTHHDIGIIKLKKPIEFNERLQPVKLPTSKAPESGEAVTIGWERGVYPLNHTYVLKQLPMHIQSRETCNHDYVSTLPSHMCARPDVGRGPCRGDSGNALILNNEIIGIMSIGASCEEGASLLYTHVYSFVDWIKEVLAR